MLVTVDSNLKAISEKVASELKGKQQNVFRVQQWCGVNQQCFPQYQDNIKESSYLLFETPLSIAENNADLEQIFRNVVVDVSILYIEMGHDCSRSKRGIRLENNFKYMANRFPNQRFLVVYGNPDSSCTTAINNSTNINERPNITYYISDIHHTDENVVSKYLISILGSYMKLKGVPGCEDIKRYYNDNINNLVRSLNNYDAFHEKITNTNRRQRFKCNMYDFVRYSPPFDNKKKTTTNCLNNDCLYFK